MRNARLLQFCYGFMHRVASCYTQIYENEIWNKSSPLNVSARIEKLIEQLFKSIHLV
jgi:hypothetical protein